MMHQPGRRCINNRKALIVRARRDGRSLQILLGDIAYLLFGGVIYDNFARWREKISCCRIFEINLPRNAPYLRAIAI
jgi:hypothetical protein